MSSDPRDQAGPSNAIAEIIKLLPLAKYSKGEKVLVHDPSKPRSFLRAEIVECIADSDRPRYLVKVSSADLLWSLTSKEKAGFTFEVDESKIVTVIKNRQSFP